MTPVTLAPYDPGSFRDRHARVFHTNGRVFRALDSRAADDWRRLTRTGFFARLLRNGAVVGTEEASDATAPLRGDDQRWTTVLAHERIPFISYPYEWSFGMLKDAALLHLDIMEAALGEEMILKDATPFNYQWVGAQPRLIDVSSFTSLEPGDTWAGYRQFCRTFLYPLLLEAHKGIPFQPWLRGSLEGIDAEVCRKLMSWRDLLRPGVMKHVHLQSQFEKTYAAADRDFRSELRSAGFHRGLLNSNVRGLRRVVEALHSPRRDSEWSDYAVCHGHYDAQDEATKNAFVSRAVSRGGWKLVWDLGSNTGTYAQLASRSADYVVALDADIVCIDRMYHGLKEEGSRTVLPLVCNLADPSPALGWRNRERSVLVDRGTPDLTLCLALVHHLVIGAGIPLPEFVEWLRSLGSTLVIEWVSKDDPMAARLLRRKEDAYTDYDSGVFEQCLTGAFRVTERVRLPSGTRTLYAADPIE